SKDGNIQVISQSGDVVANAGQFSAGKDIDIEGRNITFNAALETESQQHTYSRKSVGIGISAVYNPKENFMAHYGDQANQGSAKGVVGKIITAGEALDKTSHQFTRAGMPYAKAQTERSSQQHSRENAQVAELNAKGNLTVKATEGSIRAQGARFTAEGDGSLWAKTDIDLGVATTTQSQDSDRKQKGIDIDGSRRPSDTVGLYHSKEQGDGKRIKEQASLLSFGGKGTLTAEQGDITLSGTQAVSQGKMAISAGNDIRITTAKTVQSQQEASQGHAIGEAVVSETERFSGYNRKLSNQDGAAINHQSATIASLNDDVEIKAGKHFHQTSGQILAKNRIDISAEKVTFDVEHNQNQYSSHQSDLKIGQFTRVISPIIDLIQSVEQSIKNKDASDRIKAAQMMGIAAQGYNLHSAINHQDNAVLFRVETGTGLAHSRQREQGKQYESIGNRVNAKHINVTARSDKLSATHTDFTSRDEQGKRLADSSVTLTGKGVELLAGENRYQHLGKNQSYGTEVGMAFSVGAKTGWSVYAKEGFNKGKQEREGVSYQNSHIDTQTFNL
ncbi:hemagglutinin repeat-containing protein, partial [Ursidibacter sp. B-7004-1]